MPLQALADATEKAHEDVCRHQMWAEERLTRFAYKHQHLTAKMKFEEDDRVLKLEAAHEAECARLKLEMEEKVKEVGIQAKEEAEEK